MAAEVKTEIELEIAHVLFIDIVGYSTVSAHEQNSRIEELNQIVRLSEQFQKAQAAKRILKVPSGDGMALVFYKSPEEPAQCALRSVARLNSIVGCESAWVFTAGWSALWWTWTNGRTWPARASIERNE